MLRMKSVYAATALALMISAASLVHAQGGSTTAPATAPAKAPATHATHAKAAAWPKVDLNSATREELVKLPGIGEATADKIIAARPFKMKSELMSKGLVTKAQYSKLASHVIAKQEMKK